MSKKTIDSLDYEPSPVPIGPLTIGVWMPAGLDQYRFSASDQQQLQELGVNYVEWLQRVVLEDGTTAEESAMEFCNRAGIGMPVYFEPPGFTPYDKLHNWAAKSNPDPVTDFETDLRQRVEALHAHWEGNSGFNGYLIGHEDYLESYYSPLRQTVEALRLQDPDRSAVTVGSIIDYRSIDSFMDSFFIDGGVPNVYQHELYVFKADTPNHGSKLQGRIDRLVDSYEQVARHLQGRYGRWQAILQVVREVRDDQEFYRKPTGSEIRLQAGLALSRGAAGVIYFLYSSGNEQIYQDGEVVQRRFYEGLVDENGVPTPSYYSVQELNGQLRQLSPVLEELHYHGGFSARHFRSNPLVLGPQPDLEFGLFGDGRSPSHVLVVNRRPQESRTVKLLVGGDEVRDALTGDVVELADGRARVSLEAGGMRLLEMRFLPAE